MVPSWTRRRQKLYRYYRCGYAERNGHAACPSKMIPADKVESFVVDQIRLIGADSKLQDETFRQAVAQIKAQRRGLRAEAKRIERDLVKVRADVGRLVDTLSRTTGSAADAVAADLEKAQERVTTLEARQVEVRDGIAALKAQEIDRDDLVQALTDFDPVWEVLVAPERERVMRLLIDRIDYDGAAGRMEIRWRLAGFGQLAHEVAP
jgi:site-specific DNA recombinase